MLETVAGAIRDSGALPMQFCQFFFAGVPEFFLMGGFTRFWLGVVDLGLPDFG